MTRRPEAGNEIAGVVPAPRKRVSSAFWVRAFPFLVFVGLTGAQGWSGETSRYWVYLAKTVVGLFLVWMMWPRVAEMRWRWSWEAAAVGVCVFALWTGLDGRYPTVDELLRKVFGLHQSSGMGGTGAPSRSWNPPAAFGAGSALTWFFVTVRWFGSSFVVPPLEEVFYRSLFYRYLVRPDFQSVSFRTIRLGPLLAASMIFGFTHFEWLPGILCGLIYQGLVIWKNRLGDAMTAHTITNFLLAIWVVSRGAWHFW